MIVATDIGHSWPDVAYVVALVALAVFNTLHNKRVGRMAKDATRGVVDVKRATGLVRREGDPDPGPETPPVPASGLTLYPGHRRHEDD